MSNYTVLSEISQNIVNTSQTTKDIIDRNLYDNDNQEITGEMNNNAVNTVNTMSRDNDLSILNFLTENYTTSIFMNLYEGLNCYNYDNRSAKIVDDEDSSLLVVKVPAYVYMNINLDINMAKHTFITGEDVNILRVGDNLSYLSISNEQYSLTFPKSSKEYTVYDDNLESDKNYHWSNEASINYWYPDFTTIIIQVRNDGRLYNSPGVYANGQEIMSRESDLERLDYERTYNIDETFFDYINEDSKWKNKNYAIKNRQSLNYNLSTSLKVNHRFDMMIDAIGNEWVDRSTENGLIIIELNPLDTFEINNIRFDESGLAVTYNAPIIGAGLEICKLTPIPSIMLGGDYHFRSYEPFYYGYISIINPISITNTSEKPIYISFGVELRQLTDNSSFKLNGTEIFYPKTVVKNDNKIINEYGSNDVLESTDNILWLKNEFNSLITLVNQILNP